MTIQEAYDQFGLEATIAEAVSCLAPHYIKEYFTRVHAGEAPLAVLLDFERRIQPAPVVEKENS